MEKVLLATFDPTVFGTKTISEIDAFSTMKFRQACDLYTKLAAAHRILKVPIHIVTASTLRNWRRKGTFPKKESIYYDPYTGMSCSGNCSNAPPRFLEILNSPIPDPAIVRTFQRANNIAKKEFGGQMTATEDEEEPKPPTPKVPDVVIPKYKPQPDEIPYNLPAKEYNERCVERAFKKVQIRCPVEDWPSSNPPEPIGTKYTPGWPSWSTSRHRWISEPTAEMKELYQAIALDRQKNNLPL